MSTIRFREWSRRKKWSSSICANLTCSDDEVFREVVLKLEATGHYLWFFCRQLGLRFREVWLGAEMGVRCADVLGRTGKVNSMVAFLILAWLHTCFFAVLFLRADSPLGSFAEFFC